MAQKRINVSQIESGKSGLVHLGERLNTIDNTLNTLDTNFSVEIASTQAEIDAINEALIASLQSPVANPVFFDVSSYTVQVSDIEAGQPITITLPNGKTYIVGKNHLQVLRNGVPQVLENGDYTEQSSTSIRFNADVLQAGDVITFIIGKSSKLSYNVSISYYTSGANEGLIQTITYTGDVSKTVTYNYNAQKKISSEVIVEDGKTITRTFTYNGSGTLTGISVSIA